MSKLIEMREQASARKQEAYDRAISRLFWPTLAYAVLGTAVTVLDAMYFPEMQQPLEGVISLGEFAAVATLGLTILEPFRRMRRNFRKGRGWE